MVTKNHFALMLTSSIAIDNQLDWFDFETRMRKLMHEMLEPSIRKMNEDRDVMQEL